ncbi:serine/threonine protein kinase, partial [Mariprofundus erugo]
MTTTLFAEQFNLQHELGRGSFGVVYLALDTTLRNRRVALKILHPQLSVDPATLGIFQNEAGTMAVLRHDNIVTLYTAGLWQGQRYLVMDYIDGPSLA